MNQTRKRNRVISVCVSCNRRKIKCDKKHPCTNCIKANIECEYVNKKIIKYAKVIERKPLVKRENPIRQKNLIIPSKVLIYVKPSRTFFRSALMNSFPINNTLATQCVLELRKTFQEERVTWKEKYMSYQPMMSSEDLISDSDIYLTIENKITANYDAILERLNYFRLSLNALLFHEAVPVDLLIDVFEHYFTKTKENEILFFKPKKGFEYQPIALIFLIVDLVELFTKTDSHIQFKNKLTIKGKLFTELAIRMLNYSKFVKKQSVFSIFCLICIIFTLMIYGDIRSLGFDYINIYPIFQTCYNVAVAIGLHLDLDKIKTVHLSLKSHSKNKSSAAFC